MPDTLNRKRFIRDRLRLSQRPIKFTVPSKHGRVKDLCRSRAFIASLLSPGNSGGTGLLTRSTASVRRPCGAEDRNGAQAQVAQRPLSDRNSCTVAKGGASVPEVLAPAKLEGICAVVVVPHVLEPAHRPAVGNDEEQAQKLSMYPPRVTRGPEAIAECVAWTSARPAPYDPGRIARRVLCDQSCASDGVSFSGLRRRA